MNTQDLHLEIDGKAVTVKSGTTIIEAADAVGIEIPRFCYHKKLSVAANCRMCMVEVEKAPKPLPACSTPVTEGMKVETRSATARDVQQGTMEFLLINHPLDCPICDQGGECELQDVSLSFGSDVSRFTEGKREVVDPDLGPLISTDMNRCIHCTRCVRFGEEVAGIRELGATGRGEFMAIGTFVEKSVDSEVSGNIIDICPVGALTAKPSRYKYRPWELIEHASFSPFDGVGSNLKLHLNRGKVTRIVAADNDQINECWIADRDRYSYEALYSKDRALQPQIKTKGQWHTVSWQRAFDFVIEKTQALTDEAGVLVSPSATNEEFYLLQKLARELGIHSIDHRLQQLDFRDDGITDSTPLLGCEFIEISQYAHVALIAANVRKTLPVLALRLRAAAKSGTTFSNMSWRDYDLPLDYTQDIQLHPAALVAHLAAVVAQVFTQQNKAVPSWINGLADDASSNAIDLATTLLQQQQKGLLLLGAEALNHPDASLIRALSQCISEQTQATLGYLAEGGNAVGAYRTGCLPQGDFSEALNTQAMLTQGRKAYWLFNLDAEADFPDAAQALKSLTAAEFVVSFAVHSSNAMREYADVILPIAAFSEKGGSAFMLTGQQQAFYAATQPPEEAKSAWAVLRMLGVTAQLNNFEYSDMASVQAEMAAHINASSVTVSACQPSACAVEKSHALLRINEVSLYQSDPLIRRAKSLQKTVDAKAVARISQYDATANDLQDGDVIHLSQGAQCLEISITIDQSLSAHVLITPAGHQGVAQLGLPYSTVTIEKVTV